RALAGWEGAGRARRVDGHPGEEVLAAVGPAEPSPVAPPEQGVRFREVDAVPQVRSKANPRDPRGDLADGEAEGDPEAEHEDARERAPPRESACHLRARTRRRPHRLARRESPFAESFCKVC